MIFRTCSRARQQRITLDNVWGNLKRVPGEKVLAFCAESEMRAAYRIFRYSGTKRGEIIVIAIRPHP